ncbi:MAG: serine kinase [Chloroflexota bacterium]
MSDRLASAAPAAFFQALDDAYQRAEANCGVISTRIKIANIAVEQRFAGNALAETFTRATHHLVSEAAHEADLTVCIWDSASTGVALPPIPWEYFPDIYTRSYGAQGEIDGYNDQRFGLLHSQWFNQIQMLDRQRKRAIIWVEDASKLPYWEVAFPLRTILHLWSRDLPLQLLHAAAVGDAQGGVLIVGRSGSGKSTTALACLDSDLLYAGDDYVGVTLAPEAYIHCLYGVAKLVNDNLSRFAELEPYLINVNRADDEKAIIDLQQVVPQRLTSGFRLRAILMPCITGGRDTRLSPGKRGAALLALAPTTLFQTIAAKPTSFTKLARLVREVPVYSLNVGSDLRQIPRVIAEFLKRETA